MAVGNPVLRDIHRPKYRSHHGHPNRTIWLRFSFAACVTHALMQVGSGNGEAMKSSAMDDNRTYEWDLLILY